MKQFLFLLLSAAFSELALAQIVYTDVSPDSTVSATMEQLIKSYYIDLDNDGAYEMELRHFNPDPDNLAVELHRNPDSMVEPQVLTGSSGHARSFGPGFVVNSAAVYWGQDQWGILDAPWYGGGDKFFGFRFKRRGEWHYGWARVAIPADGSSFTIKDYAYEEMANSAIATGGGISGVEPLYADRFSVRYNHSDGLIVLQHPDMNGGEIGILDILGRTVIRRPAAGDETRIDARGLARGTYIVVLMPSEAEACVMRVRF